MAREVQRNEGRGRDGRRRASASASSSETTAPIDRPSLSWMALTSLRMGSSISSVVRMMHDAIYNNIRCQYLGVADDGGNPQGRGAPVDAIADRLGRAP